MSCRIVFVEDDAELGALIADFLARHQMDVVLEPRGDAALETIAREQPDLVLLDIMLPGKDGLTLCRELRPGFDGPIVMLTSLDSDLNQILSFEIGADDFVLKTSPPTVLLARLRSLLRRKSQPPVTQAAPARRTRLAFGALVVDEGRREVSLGGQPLALSTAEFDLLWLMASHAGQVLSRDTLMQAMRGVSYDGLDRSVDVAVSRLPRKLGDVPPAPTRIKTLRNQGYLFVAEGW